MIAMMVNRRELQYNVRDKQWHGTAVFLTGKAISIKGTELSTLKLPSTDSKILCEEGQHEAPKCSLYPVYKGVSPSISDADHYIIIIKLLHSIFNKLKKICN
jgi:hypothetical protein